MRQDKRQNFVGSLIRLAVLAILLLLPVYGFTQKSANWNLDKMPVKLETVFALSALPPHLREGATVYLLNPESGYYAVKQGHNGFICFIARTEWEWGYFSSDLATAMSYDAEGARTIFPVYQDVAAMRATGRFTALQIKDSVINRINRGVYKAPAKPGISYMLAPLMRNYSGDPDDNHMMTMSAPHYMFYAPYLIDEDIGGLMPGPFIGNPGDAVLGKRKGPHGYIIVPASKAAAAKIVMEDTDLLKQLANYRSYFKLMTDTPKH